MHESEKWKVKVKSLSRVQLFATPWTAAYQAPPPMGFSRQEYWSGVPLSSPIFIYICVCVCVCVCVYLNKHTHVCERACSVVSNSVKLWTVACQAPLSMEFPKQEYWSALPFPSPGIFPTQGFEPVSLESPALAGGLFTTWATREDHIYIYLTESLCWTPETNTIVKINYTSIKINE